MGKRGHVPFDLSQIPNYLELELNRLDDELAGFESKAFTPVWEADVNPDYGDAIVRARYKKWNGLCELWMHLLMGSTTTYGTGDWRFRLPIPIGAAFPQVGHVLMYDSSAGTSYIGAALTNTGNSFLSIYTHGGVFPGDVVKAAAPFAWGAGDFLALHLRFIPQ